MLTAQSVPGALRAHHVVLAHLGLDVGHVEQPTTVTAEYPLLMAAVVVDQPPQLAALDDLADALDAQVAMLNRNAA